MFDLITMSIEDGLRDAWDNIKIDGKLTRDNIQQPLKSIRRALLEADVNLPVARKVVNQIESGCLGRKVLGDLTPEQTLIQVTYEALRDVMGTEASQLNGPTRPGRPLVIMMVGLQGTGKTTACAKLALHIKQKQNDANIMFIAGDIQRAAAVDQLGLLAQKVQADFYSQPEEKDVVKTVQEGVQQGIRQGNSVIIVDTAGRLQIDDNLMDELSQMKSAINPSDVLLVVDSMTGQEAGNLAQAFNDRVGITGSILTKTDGDSRGGAALTVNEISKQPIKFTSSGEQLISLEQFYPDRMAKRILGYGDILTLVERTQNQVEKEKQERMGKRLMMNKFDFNDFLDQYKMVSGAGQMGQMLKLIPGFQKLSQKNIEDSERRLDSYKEMIDEMQPEEREKPEILVRQYHRIRRIARDSDHTEQEVRDLIGAFAGMRKEMLKYSKMMAQQYGTEGLPDMDDDELQKALQESAGGQIKAGFGRRVKKGKEKEAKKLEKRKQKEAQRSM